MRRRLAVSLLIGLKVFWPSLVSADNIVAARTVQANAVLTAADLELRPTTSEPSQTDLASLIGLEARTVLFKGQSVSMNDVAPPALVERNQVVLLVFSRGGLAIETEGRALGRGRVGDIIQVMNLASRTTVSGTVDAYGAVQVGDLQR